ncbi:pyridoxamine 5'-phosphate oxidase family protein [Polynucleobacter sp. JS-Mosq-20-D10]|uniref:pyridoxamine 5'-phosphate oxidase family protein n=1 Tax=Polynucleobacter sp. JS-Mosq-20-D10 TaxID=2576922 RepID=UPI001BFDD33D|nr:pyridoxamine 5'-phosphate oxidase family protein [Polynucleobacter sp. JS-Mosq-20-D10]QWE01007.1 pyridoxamine 5'-phosphate oxidase family protein [Polynucleobacter sp. JS-Mosq-20-D10]
MDKIKENNLYDVVKDFDDAMLVTHSARGIHARPMAIARLDESMMAYLLTDMNSIKVEEIRANPNALLTFQSARKFATVSGELTIDGDRTLIETLWKEIWKVWFPIGKSDPNIALLKFTPSEGEFWNNAGMQGFKYVYAAAKAYVSGERPKTDAEQHSKVNIT